MASKKARKVPGEARATAAGAFLEELLFNADQLAQCRREISGREKTLKDETAWLLIRRSKFKSKVLNAFKVLGLNSIKAKNGDTFFITHYPKFVFSDHAALEKWAVKHGLYKLDENRIHTELLRARAAGRLPKFAEAKQYETIAMRKHTRKKSKIVKEIEL